MPIRVMSSPSDVSSTPNVSPHPIKQVSPAKTSSSKSRSAPLTIGGISVTSIAGRPVSSLAALAASRAVPLKNPPSYVASPHSSKQFARKQPKSHITPSPQSTAPKITPQSNQSLPPSESQKSILSPTTSTNLSTRRQNAAKIVNLSNEKLQDELTSKSGASLHRLLLTDNILSLASVIADRNSSAVQVRNRRKSIEEVSQRAMEAANTSYNSVRISFGPDGSIIGKVKRSMTKSKSVQKPQRPVSRLSVELPFSKLGAHNLGWIRNFINLGSKKLQLMKKPDSLMLDQDLEDFSGEIADRDICVKLRSSDLSLSEISEPIASPPLIESQSTDVARNQLKEPESRSTNFHTSFKQQHQPVEDHSAMPATEETPDLEVNSQTEIVEADSEVEGSMSNLSEQTQMDPTNSDVTANQKSSSNGDIIADKPEVFRPIVICGPSGAGKSTLLKRLFTEYPEKFGFSVSHTTRKPRQGEENGVHYHFVSREEMSEQIGKGQFVEHAEFSGNIYGTSFKAISDVIANNRNVILDIDSQGVELLKRAVTPSELLPPALSLPSRPLYIFLAPPSIEELENRLRGRGTESEESLNLRLQTARREMIWGLEQEGNVDVVIVNDDLDVAYEKLKSAIIADKEEK
ncbi:hypothetical protein HK098_002150 [Nowakowskiella sp. JEL0407]|nr:hypothetical protein HK098_002150 [Nowakowskiella sp. JEL0407]